LADQIKRHKPHPWNTEKHTMHRVSESLWT
jgi:hypothetical protein